MTGKSKRLFVVAVIASLLCIAVMLVIGALRDNIVFFYTPSEISQSDRQSGRQLRLGGLVKDSSVELDGIQSVFIVTDGNANITVKYKNALPACFVRVKVWLPKQDRKWYIYGAKCAGQT